MAAAERVKSEGAENDLLQRIRGDEAFAAVRERLDEIVRPALFVGRAPQQVEEFLTAHAGPALERFPERSDDADELRV